MYFLQNKTTGLPNYLFRLIPNTVHHYQTRTMDDVTKYQCRTEAFKSSFFFWTITKWNSLDLQIRNLSYKAFKKHFIHEFRPVTNSVFDIHNPIGIKLLTRLRLGLNINAEQKHLHHLFWTITEWNSLDLQIQNSSYKAFKKHFLHEFRLVPNSVFNIHLD